MHNHIFGAVAHHDEEAPLLLLQAIADERLDALIPAEVVSGTSRKLIALKTYTCLRDMLRACPGGQLHGGNSSAQSRLCRRFTRRRAALAIPKFWLQKDFCRAVWLDRGWWGCQVRTATTPRPPYSVGRYVLRASPPLRENLSDNEGAWSQVGMYWPTQNKVSFIALLYSSTIYGR